MHVAELLYSAGATLFPKITGPPSTQDWDALWPAIVSQGSQEFVLNAVRDWNYARDSHMPPDCVGKCAVRFGTAFAHGLISQGMVASDMEAYMAIIYAAIMKRDERIVNETVRLVVVRPTGFPSHHATRALILAVKTGCQSIAQALFRAGMDPFDTISNTDVEELVRLDTRYGLMHGESAFLASIGCSDHSLITTFLGHNDAIRFDNRPVLHQRQICEAYTSALCDEDVRLERLLLSYGVASADVNHVMGPEYIGQQLHATLVASVEEEDYVEVERLLQLRVKPIAVGHTILPERHTALQLLARQNETHLFEKLLEVGEDVHAPPIPEQGATALQFATSNGNFAITNMILAAGADVNAAPADYDGRTAIEGAAEWGRIDMVHYLLEAGATVQGRTNINYRRTVYRAWEEGHRALVGMIQSWKRERYGEGDCEEPEVIVQTMTSNELDFASDDARVRYQQRHHKPS